MVYPITHTMDYRFIHTRTVLVQENVKEGAGYHSRRLLFVGTGGVNELSVAVGE